MEMQNYLSNTDLFISNFDAMMKLRNPLIESSFFMRALPIFLLSLSLCLCACTDRDDSQLPKVAKPPDQPPLAKVDCVDDMAENAKDCSNAGESWNEERKRKAKALPFPVIDGPPPPKTGPTQADGAPGQPPDAKNPPSPPVAKVICDNETSTSKHHEDCLGPTRDYWTDERRDKARALEPTVPAKPQTRQIEPSKPASAGAAAPGGAGQGPKQLFPLRNDQG